MSCFGAEGTERGSTTSEVDMADAWLMSGVEVVAKMYARGSTGRDRVTCFLGRRRRGLIKEPPLGAELGKASNERD